MFPYPLFVVHDYMRGRFGKGIVLDQATVPEVGQLLLIKWNYGHLRTEENGLDVAYSGHIYNSLK